MAYDFHSEDFQSLRVGFQEYSFEALHEEDVRKDMAYRYVKAVSALFDLMSRIMVYRLETSQTGRRYVSFVGIYNDRVRQLLYLVQECLNLTDNYNADEADVIEFLEGVRQGAIADELCSLGEAIDNSSGQAEDAEADAEASATIVNSVKEQIERRFKRKFAKDILHSINEVLGILRGVA